MKTLFKLELISKNNIQRGCYLYSPIVRIGNDYFWCKMITSSTKIKASDINININEIVVQKIIPTEFHKANGINHENSNI